MILEWSAFGMSAVSAYLYGVRLFWGGLTGVVCASLFIAFGIVNAIPAAYWFNVIFLIIHAKNTYKGYKA